MLSADTFTMFFPLLNVDFSRDLLSADTLSGRLNVISVVKYGLPRGATFASAKLAALVAPVLKNWIGVSCDEANGT